MVTSLLDQVVVSPLPGAVVALVSPHAGYVYSGPTAAHAFAQVRGGSYRRVVLLALSTARFGAAGWARFMAPVESAFATPLGVVPIDRSFVDELGRRLPLTPVSHDEEHALEIELPFLQVALGDFALVPIMLGEHIADPGVPERLDALAAALAELSDDETLLVASTDLSHLEDYDAVVRTDHRLSELVAAYDLPGLARALRRGEVQACGATGLWRSSRPRASWVLAACRCWRKPTRAT